MLMGTKQLAYSLVLLNGSAPGASVTLDEKHDPITIGRDPDCSLPIDDQLCSRLNTRVSHDGRGWQVEDCSSRNGTYVNSRLIDRAPLEPGDVIRVGDTLVIFVRERDPSEPASWRPSTLATTTFVVRVTDPQQRQPIIGRLQTGIDSRPLRDAAVLCSLASELQQQESRASLVQLVANTLKTGTQTDTVKIWLVGTDGRLRRADGKVGSTPAPAGDHVLASLAMENNEALLVENTSADVAAGKAISSTGTALSVPIPGRTSRRGAIECHRDASQPPFVREDLDLAIAVAFQAGLALENLESRERLANANQQLRTTLAGQSQIVGNSPQVKELLDVVSRVASTNSTVLINGESGTGKELVARMVHDGSGRCEGPYIAVNCAAFNESLLESELFGHEKGAFTGAERRRLGQFERAHRGTIFLDEIGEMSAACQARLLRILEGHPFDRVGGNESIEVDVRIVAATHRTLPDLVDDGRFREDLYFRLRVIDLYIPPLRDRGDDVLLLAVHFLEHFRQQIGRGPIRLSEKASRAIREHDWPGNVRELRNAIERAVVLGKDEEVLTRDLGLSEPFTDSRPANTLMSLAEAERQYIQHVLDQMDGNKTSACKVLGIGRGTLYKKLQDLD